MALIVLTGVIAVSASVGAASSIAASIGSTTSCSTVAVGGLGQERGVVGLFEDDILDESLRDDILLHDLALRVRVLSDDDTFGFRLEQHAAGGDVLCTAVVLLCRSDGAEAHLEDADTVEPDLLAQFEVVLHGTAQLVEHGLDGGLFDRGLLLDVVRQVLSLDEVLVIDGRGEPLSVGSALIVLVLQFCEFLTQCCLIDN